MAPISPILRTRSSVTGSRPNRAGRASNSRHAISHPDNPEDTMIHHLSIAARDPEKAAAVLAELMGGTAVPFPPNPGSFFALQLDDHGSGVEVYPAGTHLEPGGSEGGGFVREPPHRRGFGATHFALSVETDAATVEKIAERAGW